MYVDDGYAVDATSKAAEAELKQLNDAFKLTLKPAAFFLGNNVTVHDGAQGGAPSAWRVACSPPQTGLRGGPHRGFTLIGPAPCQSPRGV